MFLRERNELTGRLSFQYSSSHHLDLGLQKSEVMLRFDRVVRISLETFEVKEWHLLDSESATMLFVGLFRRLK